MGGHHQAAYIVPTGRDHHPYPPTSTAVASVAAAVATTTTVTAVAAAQPVVAHEPHQVQVLYSTATVGPPADRRTAYRVRSTTTTPSTDEGHHPRHARVLVGRELPSMYKLLGV